jgi:hypothetical protein
MPAKGDGITKRKDGRYMARYTVQTDDEPKRDSNRGHHDFQLGLVRFQVFPRDSPSAYLSLIPTSYVAQCFRLFF